MDNKLNLCVSGSVTHRHLWGWGWAGWIWKDGQSSTPAVRRLMTTCTVGDMKAATARSRPTLHPAAEAPPPTCHGHSAGRREGPDLGGQHACDRHRQRHRHWHTAMHQTTVPCDSPCTISILRGMARTALCALQSHASMMEASYTTAEHQAQSLARWQPARA